jgi:metal-responsive CopG/Arc/MetJ family transcriptional regulator
MKRTTVTIPDSLAEALEREAHRTDTSASHIVREALTAYLGLTPGAAPALGIVGIFASGESHLSEEVESFLNIHLPDHVERER